MSRSKNLSTLQATGNRACRSHHHIIETARNRVRSVVDHEMVRAYWKIGREIVEDEQKGGIWQGCHRRTRH